jgi:hypothetical protein
MYQGFQIKLAASEIIAWGAGGTAYRLLQKKIF